MKNKGFYKYIFVALCFVCCFAFVGIAETRADRKIFVSPGSKDSSAETQSSGSKKTRSRAFVLPWSKKKSSSSRGRARSKARSLQGSRRLFQARSGVSKDRFKGLDPYKLTQAGDEMRDINEYKQIVAAHNVSRQRATMDYLALLLSDSADGFGQRKPRARGGRAVRVRH